MERLSLNLPPSHDENLDCAVAQSGAHGGWQTGCDGGQEKPASIGAVGPHDVGQHCPGDVTGLDPAGQFGLAHRTPAHGSGGVPPAAVPPRDSVTPPVPSVPPVPFTRPQVGPSWLQNGTCAASDPPMGAPPPLPTSAGFSMPVMVLPPHPMIIVTAMINRARHERASSRSMERWDAYHGDRLEAAPARMRGSPYGIVRLVAARSARVHHPPMLAGLL